MFWCLELVPVGLLVELVMVLRTSIAEQVRISIPASLNFFQALFFQLLLSCILKICDGLLCVYFFIPQFKYMKLIYSSSSSPGILQLASPQLACYLNIGWSAALALRKFRLSFRNCISCVFNCDDLHCIYFFILHLKYMKLIYSSFNN